MEDYFENRIKLVLSLGFGLFAICLINLLKRRKKWKKIGVLDEIHIYPLKGAKGLKVASAEVTKLGLRSGPFLDRGFMLCEKAR